MDRLLTDRLVLRRWGDADLAPFAALNADAEVMEHFPAPLTRSESDALVSRIEASFEVRRYGLWAIEVRETGELAGFVGLSPAAFTAPFTPAVEVGWRLARRYWGRGFASEGAIASITDGFDRLGLDEIVSFTTVANVRSRRVMERLGMVRDAADDFDHPAIEVEHPQRHHVLYRLAARDWQPPRPRRAVRTLLVDPDGRVLLVRFGTPPHPSFWLAPGGGVEPGEDDLAAARREVREETGIDDSDMLGWALTRSIVFRSVRSGRLVAQRERWALARCGRCEPTEAARAELAAEGATDVRWWTLAELAATDERIVPTGLVAHLPALVAGRLPAEPLAF